MKYENAYRSVLQFVGSDIGDGFDLDDAQAEELAKRLVHRVSVDVVLEPSAVLPHAEALFPKSDPDYMRRTNGRVVPPREKQPKQTHAEAVEVIRQFLNNDWASIAPGCLLPTVSRINHKLFFDGVNASANKNGFVRRDHLADIAGGLFQRGLLEKAAAAAPAEPPPPPPPPTVNDLNNKRVAFERKLNDRDTHPVRGAQEKAQPLVDRKPVLTEEQRLALNEQKRADDSKIAEAQRLISLFTAGSHTKTFSGRTAAQAAFREAMDAGKSAADVLRAVETKIDQITDNGSIR